MKAIIVANWKMNPATMREAKQLFEKTKKASDRTSASIIVAPPSLYLRELAASYRGRKIAFAAQNAHYETKGNFTGEISMVQAKHAGASYVIIGHSERRYPPAGGGETNEMIGKKVSAALSARLTPIVCVGEASRMKSAEHFGILKEQIRAAFRGVAKKDVAKVIVAYEPAWNIGGEQAIATREMHEMSIFICKTIVDMHGEAGHRVRILYGASISEENAKAMLQESTVRGLIVGHVSIDPARFSALLESIS